ncbi:hypothetical protein [Acinetobacter venetianus]|uniref:Lipoprotein n=1 Tax=Acinetobacter venetianus (strain ATCC 31012 / DSM 23050 / BCRC 14357 / CCUG 45561 / CIP 110063 / KCTC 2702 / LMG 19082 / RAG-1) TaxID=1191460 RepID=N8ZSW7_ACIVR|nr:hypothetical protein [Acinetobacter venetianus]ENV36869.1 hypothetical protein F959_01676 [Acinetobacter venetianus RAG-1 = CIP 110063]RZG78726.1 hypothetical protein EXE23_15155 [Acinetobacter venetianus]
MKFITSSIVLAFITLLSGCAGYSIKKGGDGDGFDFYKPEPYLLIKSTNQAYTSEIIWLPNYNDRYRVKTWNFLAKSDISFDITDGWKLSKISDKSDNTTVASKLLDIALKATKDADKSLVETSPNGVTKLYRFSYDNNGYLSKLIEVEME